MNKIMMIICITLSALLCLLPCGHAADPDPVQDFCIANLSSNLRVNGFPCQTENATTSSDFFSSTLRRRGNTYNPNGSNATRMDVTTFPGLNTLGLSMNRVDMAIGGINQPHVHPRATELGRVAQGQIYVGILDTNNNLLFRILNVGESFVIPRGLLHFQYNLGEGEATIFVSFNSQLPGITFVIEALFGSTPEIPAEILARAFRIDIQTVEYIRSRFRDDVDDELVGCNDFLC